MNKPRSLFSEEYSEDVIDKISSKLLGILKETNTNTLAFEADLGAGKTTLVKSIARTLGIKEQVQSPTYILMREYSIPRIDSQQVDQTRFVHIDAYRINENSSEILSIPELTNDPKNLIFIEWAQNVEDLIKRPFLKATITTNGQGKRKIEVLIIGK